MTVDTVPPGAPPDPEPRRVPLKHARNHLGAIVQRVALQGQIVIITAYGKDAVVMSSARYVPRDEKGALLAAADERETRQHRQSNFACKACGATASAVGAPDELAEDLEPRAIAHTEPDHVEPLAPHP